MIPSAVAPPVMMTYEEFLAWTDEDRPAEWVVGEVVTIRPVSRRHQLLVRFLLRIFSDFVDAGHLGEVQFDPFQMKTGPDLPGRQPDLLFVAAANLARLKENYLDGPADLVVEIIRPESRQGDRPDKFQEYEQGGVRECWVIDPENRQVDFFQRGADGFFRSVTPDCDGIYRSAVLAGLWLRVDWLWHDSRPAVLDVLKEWACPGSCP